MIYIFARINKQLASWRAIWQLLRGLDRNALNFYEDIDGRVESIEDEQVKRYKFKIPSRRPRKNTE